MIVKRALTGVVLKPDGHGITTGRVVVTPVLPVPADGATGVLAPTTATYQIVNGQINGEIIAPCEYIFEVYDGTALVWRYRRAVAGVPTATTLQAIYMENATLPVYPPDVLHEGDDLTLLGSAGVPAGRVPAATGTGTIVWSTAGAGDMVRAIYDTDNDGVVDAAESVPWAGVTGKPGAYPPEAHAATHAAGGGDPVSPAAIGAAAMVHTHGGGDITSQVASAATADTVPWAGVTGKPATFPPSAHASSHASGGSDAVTPAAIGAAPVSHQHAAADVTTGRRELARGGTGVDSSAWSGVPLVASGVWSAGATAADVAAIPREAGIVSVSSSRDLQASDAGRIIEASGTITITAPNGLATGFQVTIVNVGTGTVTIAAAGTLQSKSNRNKLTAQYAAATLYHRGSNTWLAIGDLST